MKRIISIIMAFMLVCLLTVAVFAEGEAADVNENVDVPVEETVPGTESPSETTPAPETPNVFSRLWEYVVKNKDTVLEITFSAVMFILLWIIKKKTNNLKTDVSSASANSISVADSQSGVIGVVNTMIDGYNAFKSDFEKVKQSDTERDKQLAAVMVTNTAILEILSRVYPNSKNLPQGVKDVVNMTYANAMKAIGDDKQLAALVTASKGLLAAGTEKAASDEEAV